VYLYFDRIHTWRERVHARRHGRQAGPLGSEA